MSTPKIDSLCHALSTLAIGPQADEKNNSVTTLFDSCVTNESHKNFPDSIKRSFVLLSALTSSPTTAVDQCADEIITTTDDLNLLSQLIHNEIRRTIAAEWPDRHKYEIVRYDSSDWPVQAKRRDKPLQVESDPITKQEHFRLLLKKISWAHFVSLLPSKACPEMHKLVFLKIALELENERGRTQLLQSPHFRLSLTMPDSVASYYLQACNDHKKALVMIENSLIEHFKPHTIDTRGPQKEKISRAQLCSKPQKSGLDWTTWKEHKAITFNELRQLIAETVFSLTPHLTVFIAYGRRQPESKHITNEPDAQIEYYKTYDTPYRITDTTYDDIKQYYTGRKGEQYQAVCEMIDLANQLNRSGIEHTSFDFAESKKVFEQQEYETTARKPTPETRLLEKLKQLLEEVSVHI